MKKLLLVLGLLALLLVSAISFGVVLITTLVVDPLQLVDHWYTALVMAGGFIGCLTSLYLIFTQTRLKIPGYDAPPSLNSLAVRSIEEG